MRMNRGKIIVGTIDFMLAAYLVIAFFVLTSPTRRNRFARR